MKGVLSFATGTLLLSAALRPASAQECVLRVPAKPVFLGDTLRLDVTCVNASGLELAWDFGDGTPQSDYAPILTGSHKYDQAGFYTIFARFRDRDVPLSGSVKVVRRPTAIPPTRSSNILFDAGRRRIWTVNGDNHTVSALDIDARRRLFEVPAGRDPRTLALGPSGNIWVASQDDATIRILDGGDGHEVAAVRLPFASRPYGIAFDPAGKNAYVSLEGSGAVVRIDPISRAVGANAALGPTPRGLAVSHDGARLFVTRHLSPMARAGAADHGEVWEVETAGFTLKRTIRLEADTARDRKDNARGVPNGLSFIIITPDGSQALVPGTKANTQKGLALDGTRPTFETSVRTIVARIDLDSNREDMATRKDVDNRSMASSLVFDRLGGLAYLTTEGTNKTLILQGPTLRNFSALANPQNDPARLLGGDAHELAPIGSVLDDKDSLLFVHYSLSREVGIYDATRAGEADSVSALALVKTVEKDSLPGQVLTGKRIFHNGADSRMGKEGYLSCAVCHPDGASDGRVWDFTDRGEGLRRTPTLRGRAGLGHGPVHWSANFDEIQDFEHDMRGPFGGNGFMDGAAFDYGTRSRPLGDPKAGQSPELDALAAYVSSLTKVRPSPFRNPDGTMTTEALAGKRVFLSEEVGCVKCHAPPNYTDSRIPAKGSGIVPGPVNVYAGAKSHITQEGFILHDVGTLKAGSGKRLNDSLRGLDTPTLKGLWENGSFLHDGSAPALADVLGSANPSDAHGKTSHLSETERKNLVAFLLQLDDLDEQGHAGIAVPRSSGFGSGAKLTVRAARGGTIRIRLLAPSGSTRVRVRLLDAKGSLLRIFPGVAGRMVQEWIWDGALPGGGHAAGRVYFLQAEAMGPIGIAPAVLFAYPH